MHILTGLKNFLQFINDNWTMIMIIIGLVLAIAKKVKDFFGKSDEEKIEIAKKQIQETMLKLITDAEVDYMEWVRAGAIKRSQVIEEILAMYPALSKVADQEELIKWIDSVIDESLKTMRDIFNEQSKDKEVEKENIEELIV